MLTLKRGVDPDGIRPELLIGLQALDGCICKAVGGPYHRVVITSVRGDKHGEKSLHRYGFAADVRSHGYTEDHKRQILADFFECLPEHYDVILENPGQANEHFHLEYDRRVY